MIAVLMTGASYIITPLFLIGMAISPVLFF